MPFYVAVEEPDALGVMLVGGSVGSRRENVLNGNAGLGAWE